VHANSRRVAIMPVDPALRLIVENKLLRQQMEDFPIGGKGTCAPYPRPGGSLRGNLARPRAKGDAAVAVHAADVRAGDAHQRMLDGMPRTSPASHRACAGGIAGAHIRGMNSHGGITFGARSREIGREEIRQAVDKARTCLCPPIGKSSICCRKSLFSTISPECRSHGHDGHAP